MWAVSIILAMSITGVLLTYQRQILARVERGPFRSGAPAPGARRLPVEALLASVSGQRGGLPADATLTLRAGAREPAEVAVGREASLYVNPYTGQVLGQGTTKWRSFFQEVTAWHRWLGAKGEGRTTAKAITGACNLSFLLLVISGPFLWLPKKWTWQHLAPITWFRRGLSGKARDFNWHNVIGLWCAVPLFFVVLTCGADVVLMGQRPDLSHDRQRDPDGGTCRRTRRGRTRPGGAAPQSPAT